MIKNKYYSEMLGRYFDSKESALSAENIEVQNLLMMMNDLREQYKSITRGLRKAYAHQMSTYRKKLLKSEIVEPIVKANHKKRAND